MINAIEWFKSKGFTFDDKITIKDVIELQADAMSYAARLAEKVGDSIGQDNPQTGELSDSEASAASGAYMASSRICLEVDAIKNPESTRNWWCNTHQRPATCIIEGKHRCDPRLGGIMLSCDVVNLDGIAEIEETV